MSEERMIELAQAALDDRGIADTVEAVGQFAPRGQSGSMFAGGMIGGVAGDLASGVGMAAGRQASSRASGLPVNVMVAVSASTIYGLHARTQGYVRRPKVRVLPTVGGTSGSALPRSAAVCRGCGSGASWNRTSDLTLIRARRVLDVGPGQGAARPAAGCSSRVRPAAGRPPTGLPVRPATETHPSLGH
jgi:hypothetical protein